jgi:HSP20 family molecular chaperone IbpA
MLEMDKMMNQADTSLHELENFGAFSTEIPLPSNVDASASVADFVEDMLEVDMPRLAVTKQRRLAAEFQA